MPSVPPVAWQSEKAFFHPDLRSRSLKYSISIPLSSKALLMNLTLANIPGAFHLPRVNWNVVRTHIEQNVPEPERSKQWSKLALQWLESLDLALGEQYRTIQTDELILFAPCDFDQAVPLFDLAESGMREISTLLGNLAIKRNSGPLVILLFADKESYGRYVAPFDPEMEIIRTSGVCFKEDYIHIALRPGANDAVQRTALHEIAHACLGHRKLPTWLEEGVTQLAEEAAVAPWARFTLDSEKAAEIKSYWHKHGLSSFWWGTGYHVADEGQQFCYQLSLILFRQIVEDYKAKLPEFLDFAHEQDAGDSAAREILGVSVAEIAGQFLGPGDWEPEPVDCQTFVSRGLFNLNRSHFDQAISDLDQAIRLNPNSFDAFLYRGLARKEKRLFADSIKDFEQATEIHPTDFDAANNLAWILATCPEDEFRNGERALQLANDVCERSGFSIWYCLGTLAASFAETGDFEQAQNFARESMHLAPDEEIAGCKERLRSYRQKTPWRESTLNRVDHAD